MDLVGYYLNASRIGLVLAIISLRVKVDGFFPFGCVFPERNTLHPTVNGTRVPGPGTCKDLLRRSSEPGLAPVGRDQQH